MTGGQIAFAALVALVALCWQTVEVFVLRRQKATAYEERNRVVALAAYLAGLTGRGAWLASHPVDDLDWDREWLTIVFIDLESGQLSWHIHDRERALFSFLPHASVPWDRHTTAEKYRRIEVFTGVAGTGAL